MPIGHLKVMSLILNLLKKCYLNSDIANGTKDVWLDDDALFKWKKNPAN